MGMMATLALALALLICAEMTTGGASLELSNLAVRATFSPTTGEMLSLVNLRSTSGPDDYLAALPPLEQPLPPQQAFCVQRAAANYSTTLPHDPSAAILPWYIKTGGDPTIKTGWKGPPLDRCCRVKDTSGSNCRWFDSAAECKAALPNRSLCLSCDTKRTTLGCPTFADAPPPPGPPSHGLFLAWVDVGEPLLASSAGWAGGTPSPANGLPGPVAAGIGPADCNLTAHTLATTPNGGAQLAMTLTHPPTALRFHVTASLGAGAAQALNLSMRVELPTGAPGASASPPANITVAFPYLTGIAIGENGSTNAGINHFSTGLGSDLAILNDEFCI